MPVYPSLPTSITPSVTTGHVGHHQWIDQLWDTELAASNLKVAPGASEADIAAIIAIAHAAGGGLIEFMGTAYTFSGAVAIDIADPFVSVKFQPGTVLTYTGSGVCLRVRMDPFTIAPAGKITGPVTIDGTGSAAGAVGIETGQIVGAGWDGVTVVNFDGAGSVGWDFNNASASTWTERCHFVRCDARNNEIDYRFRAHASAPSFLYNEFADLRFNIGSGQTALKTESPAQLFDCELHFAGNVADDGTVFDLAAQSVVRPRCHVAIEQTGGSGGVLFAPGSDQFIYASGSIQFNNFPGFDAGIVFTDYEGRGVDVVFDTKFASSPQDPAHAMGLTVGAGTLGAFVAVYDGGVGADLALLKVPFGGSLADARVAAQLDSVTKAEIGFRPGVFTSGARPAASAVPVGTMIYISDVSGGIPVWSTGSAWQNAAGAVA